MEKKQKEKNLSYTHFLIAQYLFLVFIFSFTNKIQNLRINSH